MPYTIRDFSRICGVSAFNIRYYEKKGFPLAERNESGYRQFEIADAYRFNTFNALLAQGFSVAEAVERLEENELEEYRDALERNKRAFEEERWLLEKKIAWNTRLREICGHLDEELRTVHIVTLPELCFLPCTDGFDLTPSLMLDETIADWVALLPASSYASLGQGESFAMGLVTERAIAQERGLESEKTVVLPGGECYCLLMRGDDPARELREDPRLCALYAQGYTLPDRFVAVYLMTQLRGSGRNLNYLLLKKA